MKKVFAYLTVLSLVLTCLFTAPALSAQAASVSEKNLVGTWKSTDKAYTLALYSKGVLKIKSTKDNKWVKGTWELSSDKKTVTLQEEKYLKDTQKFSCTTKKLTSKDTDLTFKKSSSKTPGASSLTTKTIVGTWVSEDKNFDMVLTSDGNVYKRGNGITEYEKVNEIGTWSLNASKKTVSVPDYVYGMGEMTFKYTNDKLTYTSNSKIYFTKVSDKTDLK